jgi:hypothetical protein
VDCSEYLIRFSEYFDGRASPPAEKEMTAHESECPSCEEYRSAVDAGRRLVRSLPPLEVPQDFRARLNHRIYHIEDGVSIARQTLGSGATTVAVVAMAALLAAVAWTPVFRRLPTAVELPPVVVEGQETEPGPFTSQTPSSTFSRKHSPFAADHFEDGFWGDTHQLLFEYSTFSHRRRLAEPARIGIE